MHFEQHRGRDVGARSGVGETVDLHRGKKVCVRVDSGSLFQSKTVATVKSSKDVHAITKTALAPTRIGKVFRT